jgi:hypothetical protein
MLDVRHVSYGCLAAWPSCSDCTDTADVDGSIAALTDDMTMRNCEGEGSSVQCSVVHESGDGFGHEVAFPHSGTMPRLNGWATWTWAARQTSSSATAWEHHAVASVACIGQDGVGRDMTLSIAMGREVVMDPHCR